jgi:hypothetical protein
MNEATRRADGRGLFWGLALIAIGTLFLLDRFGMTDVDFVIHRFWPLLVILLGVSKLVRGGQAWSALWLIAIGVWLQLTTLHVFGLTFHSSWPLLLIILGAGMVVRTFFDVGGDVGSRGSSNNDDSPEVRHDQ